MDKLRKVLNRIANDISRKDDILQEVYNKTDLYKIWSAVIENAPRRLSKSWNNLLKALQVVLKLSYTNSNTFNGIVSKFRTPIRKLDPEIYKQSLIILGRSREEAIAQKEEYKAKVSARNTARGSFPVLYVEDVFNVMDQLIISNDPYELVLAVELATGSRSIEVLKVSKYFELADQPNQIKIVGLAKDRDGKNNLKDVVIIRNLVRLNSKQILDAIEEIRSSFNFVNKTNKKISSMSNTALNKVFRERVAPLFNPQDPEYLKTLSSHKTRYISGYISYLIYGKPQKLAEESYIQAQLGHLSGESTKSYLGINIQFKQKIIRNAPDDIKALFENEIKQIKEQVNRNCPDSIDVDFSEFKNSHRRTMDEEAKVNNVVEALKVLKEKKLNKHRIVFFCK